MPARGQFKYNPGDKIGPNKILMLKRTRKINNSWLGLFECPYCKQPFEAYINNITKNNHTTSCGCYRQNHFIDDLTGQTIGRLTVISKSDYHNPNKTGVYWNCKCSCGNTITVSARFLKNSPYPSCGCYLREQKSNDLTGQRFGKLVALNIVEGIKQGGCFIWNCKCDCGNYTQVRSTHLTAKDGTKSCGHCECSHGELRLKDILNELNIQYFQQYQFDDCINPTTNKKLLFDFYLPSYNCCIEYDGEQHFYYNKNIPSSSYYTEKIANDIHTRDLIKDEYCLKHNIKLIRIPYTDYNYLDKNYVERQLSGV